MIQQSKLLIMFLVKNENFKNKMDFYLSKWFSKIVLRTCTIEEKLTYRAIERLKIKLDHKK